MVIVMDMSTGKIECVGEHGAEAGEFGEFVDEVLNAGWLPQPEARLETHEASAHAEHYALDADAFLRSLYLNQE